MRYEVINKTTGKPADESLPGQVIVTKDGKVAWWNDSGGWDVDEDQNCYYVVEERN